MPRTFLSRRVMLVSATVVSLLHLTVNGVHAQQPSAAPTQEPTADADAPTSSIPAAQAPATPWRPRRFPHLYLPPARARPQARDAERPEVDLGTRPGPRRHTGLLIGGISMWMTSYLVTVLAAGVVYAVDASDCEAGEIVRSCNDGGLMLIPLAGPFLTSQVGGEQLALAIPQLVGAALLVAGIFHYASRPIHGHSHAAARAGFALSPVPLRDGGLIAARLTF